MFTYMFGILMRIPKYFYLKGNSANFQPYLYLSELGI